MLAQHATFNVEQVHSNLQKYFIFVLEARNIFFPFWKPIVSLVFLNYDDFTKNLLI